MTDAELTTQVIPMTDEQKFFFDMRGWILLPSILSADEVAELKSKSTQARRMPTRASCKRCSTTPLSSAS